MDRIILSQIDFCEFQRYLEGLPFLLRKEFVLSRSAEIATLQRVDILSDLCQRGYMNALLPFIKVADENEVDRVLIKFFTPRPKNHFIKPTADDMLEIFKITARRVKVVRFIREDTSSFCTAELRSRPITLLYNFASNDVLDYLFRWNVYHRIPISCTYGKLFFQKASYAIINSYIRKVGAFSGGSTCVTFEMIQEMLKRTDLTEDEKHELLFKVINTFPVNQKTISQLVKNKLLKI